MEHTFFPVIDSTLCPDQLAIWVAEKYGFSSVHCWLLKTNMNHSYYIKADGEEYVLRIYNQRHRSMAQVQEEVALLNRLKHTVSVSCPIDNTAGAYADGINAPEGMRCVVLYSFAKGKRIRHLTAGHNSNIGAEMARMHMAAQGMPLNRIHYSVETLVQWAYTEAAKYIPGELEEMRFVKTCGRILSDMFSSMPLSIGVVHLDLWYDNMNIQDDGTITFFDFDNCGNGWLVLDIGYSLMQLFYTEPDKSEYELKKTAFINGYRSIAPVSDEELTLIPYAGLAIWIYYLGLQAQRFDNFANIFLSENYVRMYIGRVKEWLKYHNIEIA